MKREVGGGSIPALSYGDLGIFPGEGQTEKLYTSEKQETHQGRHFRSAYLGWSVPTKNAATLK